MLIGYARTSTTDQVAGLDAQIRDLKAAGCAEVHAEHASGAVVRDKLDEIVRHLRTGDVLVVCKLDRLARSVRHLLEIVEAIDARNAHLRVLGMGLDTSTATGKLMLSILGSVGEFERNNMLERQREGIAAAKLAGKYNGKPADKAKHAAIRKLHAEGLGVSAIARQVGCAKSTACEVIKAT